MDKRIWIGIAGIAVLAAWQLWPQAEDQAPTAPSGTGHTLARQAGTGQPHAASWPPPFPEQSEERKYVPLLPTGPQLSAAQSLAGTRDGDPRTPPIIHAQPGKVQEMPSAAELADPKAYQQYEARQNMRLYADYVQAADEEMPRLRDDIARAREMGIPPDQIAKGEEKLRKIGEMQAQLLNAHPELRGGGRIK
jgi:hypothetical protein